MVRFEPWTVFVVRVALLVEEKVVYLLAFCQFQDMIVDDGILVCQARAMTFICVANVKRKIMPCFQQTVVRRSLLTRIQLHPVNANWLKKMGVAARVLARDLKFLNDELSRRHLRVRTRLENSDGGISDERAAVLRTRVKVRGVSSLRAVSNRVSGINQHKVFVRMH